MGVVVLSSILLLSIAVLGVYFLAGYTLSLFSKKDRLLRRRENLRKRLDRIDFEMSKLRYMDLNRPRLLAAKDNTLLELREINLKLEDMGVGQLERESIE